MNIISSSEKNSSAILFEKEKHALFKADLKGTFDLIGFAHSAKDGSHIFKLDYGYCIACDNGRIVLIIDDGSGICEEVYDHEYSGRYSTHVMYNDKIYSFPIDLRNDVYIFDLYKKSFRQSESWRAFSDKHIKIDDKAPYVNTSTKEVFIPIIGTNSYCTFNCSDEKCERCTVVDDIKLSGGLFDGFCFYFSFETGANIAVSHFEKNQTYTVTPFMSDVKGEYSNIFDCSDRVVFLPRLGNSIVILLKGKKEYYIINLDDLGIGVQTGKETWAKLLNCRRIGERIFFFGNSIEKSFSTDLYGKNTKCINPNLVEDVFFANRLMNENGQYFGYERKGRSISQFVAGLSGQVTVDDLLYEK